MRTLFSNSNKSRSFVAVIFKSKYVYNFIYFKSPVKLSAAYHLLGFKYVYLYVF